MHIKAPTTKWNHRRPLPLVSLRQILKGGCPWLDRCACLVNCLLGAAKHHLLRNCFPTPLGRHALWPWAPMRFTLIGFTLPTPTELPA